MPNILIKGEEFRNYVKAQVCRKFNGSVTSDTIHGNLLGKLDNRTERVCENKVFCFYCKKKHLQEILTYFFYNIIYL